jgi:hypothetical protein
MRSVPALVLLWLCASAPVRAEMVTSETLYGWLEESMRPEGSFKDRTMALAYVAAVRDMLAEDEVCIPEKQRGRRTLQSVRDWMKANLGKWEEPAARTVVRALKEKFPCGEAYR